jgi:hypothetical protein
MRRLGLLLVLMLPLAGCSKKKAPAETANSCQTQVDGLKQFLTTLEDPIIYGGGVTVPTRTELPAQPLHPGPELMVSPTTVSLTANGQGYVEDFVPPLTEARKAHGGLYMLVDKQTPFSRVVEAVSTAQQGGFTNLAFVFMGPPADKPPRSKADDQLDAILKSDDAAANMSAISKLIAEITATCPALQALHAKLADQPAESRLKYLRDGTAPAVLTCECKLDVASLRSVMHRMFGMQTTLRVASVTLAATGKPFTAPATATWEEVSKRLEPRMTEVKFVAE